MTHNTVSDALSASIHEQDKRIRALESERNELERLLRLTCVHALGGDAGDESLRVLRQHQSPEPADIAIAIELNAARLRAERDSLRRELEEARGLIEYMRIPLRSKEACNHHIEEFAEMFGDAAPITESNLQRARSLDLEWLSDKILTAAAREEYEKARAAAREEYKKAMAAALWDAWSNDAAREGEQDGR